MKQSIDGNIIGGKSGSVRPSRAPTGAGSSGLDGNDRFVTAYAFGDARETARVPERFQVQENDLCAVVFLPILEEIVAGNIRFVADADEAGETKLTLVRKSNDGQAEGAALRAKGNVSRCWKIRREGCIQANGRIGVE
jgi:hypothetical protein